LVEQLILIGWKVAKLRERIQICEAIRDLRWLKRYGFTNYSAIKRGGGQ
jgi:hypothetical protein